jgi:N-acyl-D-amino-acid deacylase
LGLVVAPGFINMLSWATKSLIIDGNSESDIRQGVTLEVMGEGRSEGPLNDEMKLEQLAFQKDYKYDIEWTTLGEYLQFLENRGVSTNVASFVGAATLRIHEIKKEDREPTLEELERMKQLARTAMEEGALGISSALIYTPGCYAKTDELIELCKVAAEYDGMYISHLRSEGDNWLEAIDELISIAQVAGIPAEIYHLKAAGKDNWYKYKEAIQKIDSARNIGLEITTNMYTYTAGATGLDVSMPPWVQEGGYGEWARRLQEPEIRAKVAEEMKNKGDDWENLYYAAGTPDNLLLIGFRNDTLRYLTGKTLGDVARMRGTTPEETAMDLVVQDSSRVLTVYFLMSEEIVKKQIALPYMSFGSDAGSLAPVKPFTNHNPHPRAYGNFARLLGKYVREEKIISLEQAIHRLTSLPASNLKIKKRGKLEIGNYADVVIFDANKIIDKATFDEPHQFAEGMVHVFVNGTQVLREGVHTNAKPGRFVRGPGWKR